MNKKKTAVLKLIAVHKGLNPGERASFEFAEAKALINAKRAVLDDESVTLTEIGIATEKEGTAETIDTRTHGLTVEQARKLVSSIDSVEELQKLWDGEHDHPNHVGGRKGVTQAIRARAREVKEKESEQEQEAETEES